MPCWLGSGLSTAAGIPTAWRIVEELINRVARVEDNAFTCDPFAWYADRFGVSATYSGLVENLGRTDAERQAIVAAFINDENGKVRSPSAAHRALGRLVAGGWVRVILTTNFDPLIEVALAQAGVTPTVLASPEQMEGAPVTG